MSKNVTSPERSIANEIHNGHPEPNDEADSLVVGEEEEDDMDDDRQALLSSSSRAIRGEESTFGPVEQQQRSKDMSHVSNWLYVKGILVEVNIQSLLCALECNLLSD